jgi:hypothetical protein
MLRLRVMIVLLLLRRRRRRHEMCLVCHGHMAALGIEGHNCRLLMHLLLLLVLRQGHLLAGREPVGLLR